VTVQYRGKHGLENTLAAGALTGAVLVWRSGPKAMLFGAAGMMAFTIFIEYMMEAMKH
jgi:hypothetical protein